MALTDNLVSYWKLDETSGTRYDAHGSNNLTDNNTVTYEAGVLGNAAKFTLGNNEYLSVNNNSTVQTGDIDFTLACWVKLATKPGSDMGIIAKTASSFEYLLAHIPTTPDKFRFNVRNAANTAYAEVSATSFGAVTTGAWNLVIAWHDASANTLNIQVNNGTVDSASHSGGVYSSTSNFHIGTYISGAANYLNGSIDGAGLWKRVLTASERERLYNSGNGLAYESFDLSGFSWGAVIG